MFSALSLGDKVRQTGRPWVARIENSTSGLPVRPWYGRIRDIDAKRFAMLRRANAVIAMSAMVFDELIQAGIEPSRIVRIPQHCDTRLFTPKSGAERTQWRKNFGWTDRFTFVCVGEVTPRKRQLLLVRAVAQLVQEGHDVQLVLVGPINDIRYGQQIREAIDTTGLTGRIILAGFTRHVQFAFFAADAFLLASVNEGMPGSLVESMACALPAIVSDFAGATDCVKVGESGWIVPAGAEEFVMWVALMKELVRGNCVQQFGDCARQVAESRFDSRLICPQYETVLRTASTEGAIG
jgi:glycosyltransferase involved in cell wall biosynthesis